MALNPNISLFNLCKLLVSHFGKDGWQHLEPETVMIEFGAEDHLFTEKFRVLQELSKGAVEALSRPEFFLWTMAVANNEPAEFEWINMPSCLELVWGLDQAKRCALVLGQTFEHTEEIRQIVEYLLKEEGFSEPTNYFDFIHGETLEPGADSTSMDMKRRAMQAYLEYMEKTTNV